MDEPVDDLSALDAAASPPASTGSTEAPPRLLGGESPPRNFPDLDSAATTEASPLLGRYLAATSLPAKAESSARLRFFFYFFFILKLL